MEHWEVRTYVEPVFGGQGALTCKEIWAGKRRIATTLSEANAEHIVRAVNSHAALVEACEIALRRVKGEEVHCMPGYSVGHKFWLADKQKIEQALAGARGEA